MHRKIAVTGHRPKGLNKAMKYGNVNDDKFVEYTSLMQSTVCNMPQMDMIILFQVVQLV